MKNLPLDLLPEAAQIYRQSGEVWPDRAPVTFIGKSPALKARLQKITKFANFREPVLILGKSGTGKKLIARAHDFSHALGHEEFQEDAPPAALAEPGVPPRQEEAVSPAYDALYRQVLSPDGGFWNDIRPPFLEREFNRGQVRPIVERGLSECGGNYTELLHLFHIKEDQYGKFMDFLRTHNLKIGGRGRRSGEKSGRPSSIVKINPQLKHKRAALVTSPGAPD